MIDIARFESIDLPQVRESDTVRIALFNQHVYISRIAADGTQTLHLHIHVTPASWRRIERIQNRLPREALVLWRY